MLKVIETDTGHRYEFAGKPVPGVSEILASADVVIGNAFYEAAKEAAAVRGREVHVACWDLDRKRVPWWKGESIEGYVDAYALFVSDFQFVATHIERPMFHDLLHYAGTPDRLGSVYVQGKRKDVTVDLKATSTIGPAVGIQIAAYNQLSPNPEERDMIAVQLKPSGKYSLATYDDKNYWTATFFAALTLYNFKQRHFKEKRHEK